MEQDNEQAVAKVTPPSEHSELIKKQLAVARDIQMLAGNEINENEAMLLSSMYQSGYFKSIDSLSKAVTRVVFGKMIGIPVATALTSLYIIDGKPGLESKAIRNTLNMAGYSIVTKKLTDKECILDWSYKSEHLGESSFTIQQAVMRGYVDPSCLEKPNWPYEHNDRPLQRYNKFKRQSESVTTCECKENWRAMPRNMLVARATSEGNNQYGNKAFKQEVYDIDELIDSPFREDTTPVDVARAEITKAKDIDKLQEITARLQPDELEKLLPDISARTKELLENAKPATNNSKRATA